MEYKKPQVPMNLGDDYIYPLTTMSQVINEDTGERLNAFLLNYTHPIGSLYWSKEPTDPSQLFGGTWQRVKDVFILAAGDTYAVGATGGEAEHTLTVEEMPSHTHNIKFLGGKAASGTVYGIFSPSGTLESGAITSTGSSQPHNNMPPYEVFYCWKRVS